ncbi:hypothetical protein [Chryseobacterium wangxinyae]|uniref:hypothetical protein n=1 Tax=Chryseobacterium sp. CY353 TaxID=2997334 RepID=UPI00226EF60E|nr:hypothetical protein [Chryseobacterium sp. CY353]MCY0968649.1 hypothetical protein [Chryseobacterium sp. CY353]
MDELELLKADWSKESKGFKEYSENEIYNMIKQRSVSITKILFLIGLIELSLWAVYGYIDGQFPGLRIALFALFFALTLYFFLKVKIEKSSMLLMKGILNIKRVILGYAVISFLLIVIDNIFNFNDYTKDFLAGVKDGYHHNNLYTTDPQLLNPQLGIYIIFAVLLLFFMYILFLIYKSTYGKILSHLRKNYKELSEIEEKAI